MYKILVPVDFYETSFAAYNYAMHFGNAIPEAEITLLHVVNGSFNTNYVISYDPMEAREEAAKRQLDYFVNEYPKELGVTLPDLPVKQQVSFGFPGFSIADFANDQDFDIIIMGTRDKPNLFDNIIGTSSSATLHKAECPTMLIHQNVRFNEINKIIFAFDAHGDLEDALEDFLVINNNLKAATEFVHVLKNKNEDLSDQKKEIVEELFEEIDPQFFFEIKTIEGENVSTRLMDHCLNEKADLLVLVQKEQGILQRFFRRSNTIKIARNFHLPVLVLQQ